MFVQTGTHTLITTKEKIIRACGQLHRYNVPVDHYLYLDLDRYSRDYSAHWNAPR